EEFIPFVLALLVDEVDLKPKDWVKYFGEKHFAGIPRGSYIRITRDGWNLPRGTLLVHDLWWKATGARFETRVSLKLTSGMWAFGSYVSDADGRLRLRPAVRSNEEPPTERISERAQVQRMQTQFCRFCHGLDAHGLSPFPLPAGVDPKDAGS